MWISKKRWNRLEKRIADLEMKIQSQQEEISSHKYPYKALKKAFEEASHQNLRGSSRKIRCPDYYNLGLDSQKETSSN